jgi:hypothetical protein
MAEEHEPEQARTCVMCPSRFSTMGPIASTADAGEPSAPLYLPKHARNQN